MKTSSTVIFIVILLAAALLGYGLYSTLPSGNQITSTVQDLTPANEKGKIDSAILNNQVFGDIEALKIFGKRPVGADSKDLNRPNPFDGI